ncbi:hypothetical protein BJV74DRAFT_826191 [Russula compacta]|nr:hypothetical protein BJV74DRAFT_826191 [Russula compacta]
MRTCCRSIRLASAMTIPDNIDSTLYPSRFDLVFRALWCYIPEPLLYCVRDLSLREYRRFRAFLYFTERFSRGIVRESTEKRGANMLNGDGAPNERWEAYTEIVRLW